MRTDRWSGWRVLERWRRRALLTGGVLLLAYTVLTAASTVLSVATPGWVGGLLSGGGLVAASVGMLGFFPRMADRAPRLARASATLLAGAAVAVVVVTAWGVGAELLAQGAATEIASPSGVVLVASIGLVALGVLSVGIASLWTGSPPRPVGALLFTIVGVNLGYFAAVAAYGAARPAWLNIAVTGAHPVLLLAISYVLPPVGAGTASQVAAGDSAT